MKIKIFIRLILLAILPTLFLANGKHVAALVPVDDGSGAVSTSAPVPNGVKWQPNNNPSNYNPGSGAFSGSQQAFLDIGNDADYSHSANVMKIYVHKGDNITLTIHNAGPACHTASGGGVVGPDYADNSSSLGPATHFVILDNTGAPFGSPKTMDHGSCADTSLSFSASSCGLITDQSLRPEGYDGYCYLNAWVDLNDSIQGENSFTIESTSGNYIGLSGELTGYGFRTINLCDASCGGQSKANHWSSQTIFSVDQTCQNTNNGTQAATTSGPVIYADADANNSNWNPNLNILLQSKGLSGGSWSTIGKMGSKSNNGEVTLYNGSFDSKHLYRVLLLNVGVRNTIFLGLQAPGLSQMAAKYQLQTTDCGSAILTCTASPTTITTPGGSSLITINGRMSSGQWPSTYYIKRTGPTYRDITNDGDPSGQDQVTPPENTKEGTVQTTTYTYVIWDSATNKEVTGSSGCTVNVQENGPKPAVSCTAEPSDPNPALNSTDSITVTLYNNGSTNLKGDQLRQYSPGGGTWDLGNFTKGQHASHTFNIIARSTRQTVEFDYALFNGTSAGASVIGAKPLCSTSITWGASMVKALCNKTTISGVKSTATWEKIIGYTYKDKPKAKIKTASYQFSNQLAIACLEECGPGGGGPPPPPGGPPPPPPQHLPIYQKTLITNVPVRLTISGNGQSGTAYATVPNDGGTHDIGSIFDYFGGTWPHIGGYSVHMEYATSGDSYSYQDDPGNPSAGAGDYSWSDGGQSSLGTCLNWACGGPTSPPDGEPGSNQKFSYTFNFNNSSNLGGGRANLSNGNGYYFLGYSSGGINAPGGPISVSPSSLGGGSQNYTVSFNSLLLYSGTYGINFYFNGQLMAGCSSSSTITPATRPYFQVPYGSIATGGAFRATDNSCSSKASGNPPYIGPVGGNQYDGGVQAFYSAGSNTGSKVQYYGDILGNIYTGASYTGFAGVPQTGGPSPVNTGIAATPTSQGNGGYLNSNSQNHCVNDLYTNTRISSSPPNLNGTSISTNTPTGQYTLNAAVFNGGSIGADQQITLYVNGDVTIKNNVTYKQTGWNATSPKTIPYFMMIVRGNVYIAPGVTQLDGLYVAQPTTSGSGGLFHTCDGGSHFCTKQLVVNGAVLAQGVRLERAHGTLGVGVSSQVVALQPAEIFNYSPLLVIGVPYIVQTQNSPTFLEGLYSLPPVF